METLQFLPYDPVNLTHKQKVNKTRFGDGYSQRQPADINNARQRWGLNLPQQGNQAIQEIDDFFENNKGLAFYWTPPDDVQRKFICRSWNRVFNHFTKVQTISATLDEVYE